LAGTDTSSSTPRFPSVGGPGSARSSGGGPSSRPDPSGGDLRTQAGLGRHVDVAAEEVTQIHQQAAEVEQAAAILEVDEEVDVAGR
jgi:hypothetical protein